MPLFNPNSGGGGTSGYSGFSGVSGYSGYSGRSGYSGYSGSGVSGYSGYSGSGVSGYSGYSGKSGYSGTPAGSNTYIQYNNAGAFGADAALAYDQPNGTLLLGAGLTIKGGWGFSLNPWYVAYFSAAYNMGFAADPTNRLLTIFSKDADGSARSNLEFQTGATPTRAAYITQDQSFGIDKNITLEEVAATPTDPTSGTQARIYLKGDKLVIQFNDGGTVRYKWLDLTGTGVTWTHSTSAP